MPVSSSGSAAALLEPAHLTETVWFHGGHPGFWDAYCYVHVGTRAAAAERVGHRLDLETRRLNRPEGFASDQEHWGPIRHALRSALFEVRLDPAATVAPFLSDDEDFDDLDLLTPATLAAMRAAGNRRGRREIPEFDVYPYLNDFEDRGSISLLVNPQRIRSAHRAG